MFCTENMMLELREMSRNRITCVIQLLSCRWERQSLRKVCHLWMNRWNYFPFLFFSNRTIHSPGDSILKNTAYGTCKSTPLYKWQITWMPFEIPKQEKYITTEHAYRRVQIMSKWTYLPPSFNFHSSNKDRKCIAPENIKCPKKFVDGNFSLSFVCKPPIVCALSKRSVKSLRIGPIEHWQIHNFFDIIVVAIVV